MQVGIFNCLFIFVIAALNDYVIVASIIVIALEIRLIVQPYLVPIILILTDAVCSFLFFKKLCWDMHPCTYSRMTMPRFIRLKE